MKTNSGLQPFKFVGLLAFAGVVAAVASESNSLVGLVVGVVIAFVVSGGLEDGGDRS